VIVYENVTKRYNDVTVVDGLNLTINDGEFVVFIGPLLDAEKQHHLK